MGEFYQSIEGAPSQHPKGVDGTGGVIRDPPTGITVLIAGAGVGGLTAALECYRKGHTVRIFERAPCMTTAGDMFTIGLSARKWIFAHWPEMKEELDQIGMQDGYQAVRQHTGKELQTPIPFMQFLARGFLVKSYSELPMCHHVRPLFHRMLYHQLQKLGIEISYNKRIVDYFEDEAAGIGGVLADDGERTTADVVIASDGIGSKSQWQVNGGIEEARSSGKSVYRGSVPTKLAFGDPFVKETYGLHEGKHPIFRVHIGPGTHAMTLTRGDSISWSITYSSNEATLESWHNIVSKEQVFRTMDEYPGYSEGLRALIQATPPDRIINWPIMWRNSQPKWTSPGGRIVQVGDAAHSFLPTSGNGASQAIEDGVTIATCLALAGKSNIPLALKVHNKLRFERVSYAQKLGFANAEILGHQKPSSPVSASPPKFPTDGNGAATNGNGPSTNGHAPTTNGNTLTVNGNTPTTNGHTTNRNMPTLNTTNPTTNGNHLPSSPAPTPTTPGPNPGLKTSSGRPMIPKWIFLHDPEAYALDNFDACAASIVHGTDFVNTNVPPGSSFMPWTMDEIIEDAKNGKGVQLDGDWS